MEGFANLLERVVVETNLKRQLMERELIQKKYLLEFQPKTSFCFISKGRIVNVGFDEITHVSKWGSETIIHTTNKKFRTYLSLQEILNDLPVNGFARLSRSHIVSLRHMNGVKKKRIVVGEYYLPVSKYYKLQLCKKLALLLDRNYFFIIKDE